MRAIRPVVLKRGGELCRFPGSYEAVLLTTWRFRWSGRVKAYLLRWLKLGKLEGDDRAERSWLDRLARRGEKSNVTMDRTIAETAKSYMKLPFRRAVLRGLGVVLPPLLTIVILVWILSTIQNYFLTPIELAAKRVITWVEDTTLTEMPPTAEPLDRLGSGPRRFQFEDRVYVQINEDQWIPESVYSLVQKKPGDTQPSTSQAYYHRYVELRYLKRIVVLPVFFILFVLLLYFLGRFLAYGVGRMMYNSMERIISQLPIIRTVYTSVKQVTDFVFTENEMEFTRVVAVEYPRKGIWSLGFVTGDGMRTVAEHAGEPIVTVLIPTSPMPATGYTITVCRSETMDLNISVDQAFQFIVSCGVVVPMPQQYRLRQGPVPPNGSPQVIGPGDIHNKGTPLDSSADETSL